MKKVYLFATIMAIVTAIAIYFFAANLQENSKKSNIQTKQAVVAAVEIKENTLITSEMVTVIQVTYNAITEGTAENINDVINKVTKYPILPGEQIITKKLADTGVEKAGELALMLPQGHRAITINVDDLSGVSGYVKNGDYVDLITSVMVDGKSTTGILVEKIMVIKVGTNAMEKAGPVDSYATVTFSASVTDALKISHAINSGGVIRLLLRPTLDTEPSGLPILKF